VTKIGESPGFVASEAVLNWGCDVDMGSRPPLVMTSEVNKPLAVVSMDQLTSVTVWIMLTWSGTEAAPVVGGVTNTAARLKLAECVVLKQIWPVGSSYTDNLLGPPQNSVVFAAHAVEQSLSLSRVEVGGELPHQHS